MTPFYKEFSNDEEAVGAVQLLKSKDIHEDNIFVISHDDDHTQRVADRADANKVGAKETGLSTSVKNIFRKKGDELRAKFEELGYTENQAEELENKLDEGKVIVIVKDAPNSLSL
ncbi:general stress protein [Alteribacillus sp. HJP-4]|uniref:general stress protein n=1 Tax=Alteribacillus sp. HJP-4 TaxID=2775394 RepID=UPI0035CD207D